MLSFMSKLLALFSFMLAAAAGQVCRCGVNSLSILDSSLIEGDDGILNIKVIHSILSDINLVADIGISELCGDTVRKLIIHDFPSAYSDASLISIVCS